MTRTGLLAAAAAVLAAAALAPPASARFGAPVQLATGSFEVNVAAGADAAGSVTVLTSSGGHGPRLYERPAGGSWSAPAPLPGDPKGVAGPVVDAAGNGALGIAWRIDVPRHYSGIAVAMRDPGGALGEPTEVAGADAGGVRHPALAIDPAGDALLAYQVGTNATHLNLGGGIAIAHRSRGGAFEEPTVVDRAVSSAPAVALAADGTGIVAWSHNRHVYAVSIEAGGRIGTVKRVASPDGVASLVAAAGEDGAATLAWIGRHTVRSGRTTRTRRDVQALTRRAGHAFGAVSTVASSTDYVRSIAVAGDEDGNVTLAWAREHFGDDRSIGVNGITAAILAATAVAGERFPTPAVVAKRGSSDFGPPVVAAANGRIALTWGFQRSRHASGIQAVVGAPGALDAPQTLSSTPTQQFFGGVPQADVALAGNGTATVVSQVSTAAPPAAPVVALLAADGS